MATRDPAKRLAAQRRYRAKNHVERFGPVGVDRRGRHGNHARVPHDETCETTQRVAALEMRVGNARVGRLAHFARGRIDAIAERIGRLEGRVNALEADSANLRALNNMWANVANRTTTTGSAVVKRVKKLKPTPSAVDVALTALAVGQKRRKK